jgi:hypothetical protein
MTMSNVFSAVLIGAAMIAPPAMARATGVASRHITEDAYASNTLNTRYSEGRTCVRAPDVGAFASQPYAVPPCEPMTGY